MPYPVIIPLITRIDVDTTLRERLRCEYLLTDHALRPDFPPDLVLRDQDPPGIILKDEILVETYWRVDFGNEIVVNPFPFAAVWRTGIQLAGGWSVVARNGELVVTTEPLEEPFALIELAPFQMVVVDGELVYTPPPAGPKPPGPPANQEFFNIAWAFYFGEEIKVFSWPYTTPMNGIVLAPESPSWVMRMENGEIVLEESLYPESIVAVPFLRAKPDRWKFGLEMINGEMVYTPFVAGERFTHQQASP